MQGFHAAVQHFGKAGVVRHFNHGDADIGKQLGGSACGQDFYAHRVQSLGKGDDACFVG